MKRKIREIKSIKICSGCGNELDKEMGYCYKCGKEQDVTEVQVELEKKSIEDNNIDNKL